MDYHSCQVYYFQFYLVCVLVLADILNTLTAQDEFVRSRATYTGSPNCYSNPTGACGYGEYGISANHGIVTGVSRLYMNGSGCGNYYQVRCKVTGLCNDYGTTVIVTDYGEGDRTDFILSERAFTNLANPNMADKLISLGVVDIEYRQILCDYPKCNVVIKIDEHSHYPDYIALIVRYNDVTGVELWDEDYEIWVSMRRVYGAVWDIVNPPSHFRLRVQVAGGNGIKYVTNAIGIPSDWKAGDAYDAEVQLN